MEKFTRDDLESGMRIKLRNGNMSIIIKNKKSFIGVGNEISPYVNMNYRDKNTFKYTECKNCSHLDIIEIYDSPTWSNDYLKITSFGKLLWKEEEPVEVEVKEVTLSEIAKLYGCEVKIVKEK